MSIETIILGSSMALIGLLMHILKKVVELRIEGEPMTMTRYAKEYPYRIALSGLTTAASVGMLVEIGQLTVMGALMAGYMADSMFGVLSAKAKQAYK